MTFLVGVLLVAIGLVFIWRVIALMRKFNQEPEPTAPHDGDSGVREPAPKRPPAMSGAVALDESEDEEPTNAVSRK